MWPFTSKKPSIRIFKHNGYTIAHQPLREAIANSRIIIHAGARDEDDDSHGTAHFLEHMFFKGTERRSCKEINSEASKLGDINAYTSRANTVYHLTHLPENFEKGIDILQEMIFYPAFPKDEFEREIGVILAECQTYLDSPTGHFHNLASQHLTGVKFGHPVIGTLKSIKATTVPKLRRFIDQWYSQKNMVIAVAGDISEKRIRNAVDLLPCYKSRDLVRNNPVLNYKDFHCHHASKQAIIRLAAPGYTARKEQELNNIPDIFNNGFGQGMHSMLFDRLREELGLCYHVSSHHSADQLHGIQVIVCLLDEAKIPIAREEVDKLIVKVKKDGFSKDLLETVKANYLFDKIQELQGASALNYHVDMHFTLDGYPLEKVLSLKEARRQVDKITNDDIVWYANKTYKDDSRLSLSCQTNLDDKAQEKKK